MYFQIDPRMHFQTRNQPNCQNSNHFVRNQTVKKRSKRIIKEIKTRNNGNLVVYLVTSYNLGIISMVDTLQRYSSQLSGNRPVKHQFFSPLTKDSKIYTRINRKENFQWT